MRDDIGKSFPDKVNCLDEFPAAPISSGSDFDIKRIHPGGGRWQDVAVLDFYRGTLTVFV
jgi:hypothetical protein